MIKGVIYLELSKEQGLGNQLWNYAALRAIAEYKGYDYQILGHENFKGHDFIKISYGNSKGKRINKNNLKFFNEKIFYDDELNTFACDFDENIIKIKPGTIINGLFQSEKYFFNKDINKYMKVNKTSKEIRKALCKKCILNIRGGEYKRFRELILPKSYWINAMNEMKKFIKDISFLIITDDYSYSSNLLPGIEILKGDIKNDFLNIYYADYLIVSNSSFSYFPIKLGKKAKKVIAPANWARYGNKFNRWISPANFYKDWEYMSDKGILSKQKISESLINTHKTYLEYNVVANKNYFKRNSILFLIPKRIRKLIKFIMSKIFPLYIG